MSNTEGIFSSVHHIPNRWITSIFKVQRAAIKVIMCCEMKISQTQNCEIDLTGLNNENDTTILSN